MKKQKFFLGLSILSLSFIVGCNGGKTTDNLTKLKTTTDAAIIKVDELNETLGKELPPEIVLSKNAGLDDNKAYYFDCSNYRYCEEQAFGLYIFNNIYYCLHNFYGNNNINVGDVIKGSTKNLPDKRLIEIYKNNPGLPDPVLAAKCSVEGDENTYIVNFDADWDFRNSYFEKNLIYMNSIIMTSGRITYSKKDNKLENISFNYYWTGSNRDFASFNLDYVNNKFYCVALSSDKDNSAWGFQKDGTAIIHSKWNEGNLTADTLKNMYYHYMYVFEGNITTDLTKLELKSKQRLINKYSSKDITETEDGKNDFDKLFNEVYLKNKDVKVRGDTSLIDLSNAKDTSIDNCVKYGEAKTKLYWIIKKDTNESSKFSKAITPYQSKENLLKHFDTLKTKQVDDNQKALLEKAINYLNNLKDGDYYGEFEDTTGNMIKYSYVAEGQVENERNNVYECSSLQYVLQDLKTTTNSVKFIIENGEVKLNESFR